MRYVTYDNEGNLTGCYLQELRQEHDNSYLEISEEFVSNWPSYKMNPNKDGLIKIEV